MTKLSVIRQNNHRQGKFYHDDGRFNFLKKINKMLPLLNFCTKVFARINTFKQRFSFSVVFEIPPNKCDITL